MAALVVSIMNQIVSIELEWNYTPPGYFEEPLSLNFDGILLDVDNGIAIAKITPAQFENNECIKEDLNSLLESRFHAVQIFNHKDFELHKPSRTDITEDGRKHHYLEVESIVCMSSLGSLDIVVTDKDGNIVSDTKKERLDKQEKYAEAMSRHRKTDPTLNQMVDSYQMSVKDSANEFVHLYEIRDALTARFNSKKLALKELYITSEQWNEIGMLANALPVKQGRHRGNSSGLLRAASPEELEQARKSIVNLIEKYLDYLEQQTPLTRHST